MAIQLRQLVAHLGGDLVGNPEGIVSGIAPLDAAGSQHVSFLSNPKLRAQAAASAAAALILTREDSERIGEQYAGARILVDRPYAYFARAAQWFAALSAPPRVPGVHPTAAVDPAAVVGEAEPGPVRSVVAAVGSRWRRQGPAGGYFSTRVGTMCSKLTAYPKPLETMMRMPSAIAHSTSPKHSTDSAVPAGWWAPSGPSPWP